jgi:DNA-binding CsgD family transcriptional regulator/tetratricopeptide (TPR) repeat protein
MVGGAIATGRSAFEGRRWGEACTLLRAADDETPLDADDLERWATAAYLSGDDAWQSAWSRAYQLHVDRGETARAGRCTFWLVFGYFNAGEMAQGGGWLARAQRLVDELGDDSAEAGYLLLPGAIAGCEAQPEVSIAAFRRALEIGESCRDRDLIAMSRHGVARCLIVLGDPPSGMAMLDEVLVVVTSGEVSPMVAGDTYCGAIEACQLTFDLRRAREWTSALSRWCDAQPGLVAFRGQCMVYLAAVSQARGDWTDAMDVAEQACQRLSEPALHPAIGAAYYQRAELQRLRGSFADAEESYRQAGAHGRDPQPGLALLRLAQGQADAALSGIRRVLDETADPTLRSAALPAHVEILLAMGDVAGARAGSDELQRLAKTFDAPLLLARASYAAGSVLVAEGEHRAALKPLRQAFVTARALDAPYDAARARVLIGVVCKELGDGDGTDVEWQAARRTFADLGAAPDIARLDVLMSSGETTPGGLTAREMEILRLVATGRTNRAIGDELVISEKTVARHVSNIFDKLGVSSRSAATAFAYDHGLVQRPT